MNYLAKLNEWRIKIFSSNTDVLLFVNEDYERCAVRTFGSYFTNAQKYLAKKKYNSIYRLVRKGLPVNSMYKMIFIGHPNEPHNTGIQISNAKTFSSNWITRKNKTPYEFCFALVCSGAHILGTDSWSKQIRHWVSFKDDIATDIQNEFPKIKDLFTRIYCKIDQVIQTSQNDQDIYSEIKNIYISGLEEATLTIAKKEGLFFAQSYLSDKIEFLVQKTN